MSLLITTFFYFFRACAEEIKEVKMVFNNGFSDLNKIVVKKEEKLAVPVVAVEEDLIADLKKELESVADLSYEEVKKAHENQQEKIKQLAFEVLEAEKKVKELGGMLKGMPGESRTKTDILRKKQILEKKVNDFYTRNGLKRGVEIIKLIQEASKSLHFGDLSRILKKTVDKNLGHTEEMSYKEALERFPGTIIVFFGRLTYIINDFDLGKELLLLRQRAIVAKKEEAAKKTAAAVVDKEQKVDSKICSLFCS